MIFLCLKLNCIIDIEIILQIFFIIYFFKQFSIQIAKYTEFLIYLFYNYLLLLAHHLDALMQSLKHLYFILLFATISFYSVLTPPAYTNFCRKKTLVVFISLRDSYWNVLFLLFHFPFSIYPSQHCQCTSAALFFQTRIHPLIQRQFFSQNWYILGIKNIAVSNHLMYAFAIRHMGKIILTIIRQYM